MNAIDLVWLGDSPPPAWSLGEARRVDPTSAAVADFIREHSSETAATAWLFWDQALGAPAPDRVERALGRPGDVWHCGLRLGMGGLPRTIDHLSPTWMLARDPSPEIEATSWRLSLRACLIRVDVLRALGGVRSEFTTLEGASLEMGHRLIRRGALVRYVPWLLSDNRIEPRRVLPFEEELRWARHRSGRFWAGWACWRSVVTGRVGASDAVTALKTTCAESGSSDPPPFVRKTDEPDCLADDSPPEVAVLIPTVDRYPYLMTLLDQLRRQTVPPAEVIVIDQTRLDRRITDLVERFPDLPLKVFELDRPGQCSSRNLGLKDCRREFILFLDDDDEVEPDLIEAHLRCLARHRADISCGVTRETDGTELPPDFTLFRASDVFPTNNTMVRRERLAASGLFDLAYDRGARADADLGTRLYLTGGLAVLDPSIVALHHHAPSGGLRTHNARKVTYASSQRSLTQRHLPSPTEIYLALRYSTPEQVREALLIRVLQTFRVRGGILKRLAKLIIATVQLPSTLWRVKANLQHARAMFDKFPSIGRFTDDTVSETRSLETQNAT